MKKYRNAIIIFLVFEVIAAWLWLSTGNLFFLLNFSYLGISIGGGAALLAAGWKYLSDNGFPQTDELLLTATHPLR